MDPFNLGHTFSPPPEKLSNKHDPLQEIYEDIFPSAEKANLPFAEQALLPVLLFEMCFYSE